MRFLWWAANWWLLVVIIIGLGVAAFRSAVRRKVSLAIVLGAVAAWLAISFVPASWEGQSHRARVRSVDVIYTETSPDIDGRPIVEGWLKDSLPRQKAFAAERVLDGRVYLVRARRQNNRNPADRVDELLGRPGALMVPAETGPLGGVAGCAPQLDQAWCVWADYGTSGIISSTQFSIPELAKALPEIRAGAEKRADRYHPFREAGRFVITLLGVILVIIASLVVHELGHAAMAKVLGCELLTICVGAGQQLFDRDLGSADSPVRLLVRLIPIGGYIQNVHRSGKHFRRNQALVSSAGPATNMLAAAMVAVLVSVDHPAVLLNVLLGLANLIPYSKMIPGAGRRIGTDGYQVIEVLGNKRTFDPTSAVAPFLVRAEAALDRNQPDRAKAWIERGLSLHPTNESLAAFGASRLG
jgi:Zn-dependent protease